MKIYVTPTSPFARIVRIVLREKDMLSSVEEIMTKPWDSLQEFTDVVPASKVPALLTNANEMICDSQLISLYLDRSKSEPQLIPETSLRLMAPLQIAGVAHATIESAVAAFVDTMWQTPPHQDFQERQHKAIKRSLEYLEKHIDLIERDDRFTYDRIVVAVVLDYIALRLANIDWRTQAPNLAVWFDKIKDRPSMLETTPPQ